MLKQTVFTALAAAAVSTSALIAPAMLSPAAAQGINVMIGTPPPAPVYEVVPAPRHGYVWAPGYYRWEGNRHVWTHLTSPAIATDHIRVVVNGALASYSRIVEVEAWGN